MEFSDELNEYYRRLCKFLKKVLPEDEGVDHFTSPQYADKVRNALAKDNWLIICSLFGIGSLLGTMEFLARNDRFEQCCEIRDYIKELNKKRSVKFLPTTLKEIALTY